MTIERAVIHTALSPDRTLVLDWQRFGGSPVWQRLTDTIHRPGAAGTEALER